jgi:mono/diheme cytochrome c family protein
MSINKLVALAVVAVTGVGMMVLPTSASHAAQGEPGYTANAAHGLDLAKRWCASCHLVSADQKRAVADVPPFATIAQTPDFDADRLARFLLDPHPKMPELPLGRRAADDIAAYIASLKK